MRYDRAIFKIIQNIMLSSVVRLELSSIVHLSTGIIFGWSGVSSPSDKVRSRSFSSFLKKHLQQIIVRQPDTNRVSMITGTISITRLSVLNMLLNGNRKKGNDYWVQLKIEFLDILIVNDEWLYYASNLFRQIDIISLIYAFGLCSTQLRFYSVLCYFLFFEKNVYQTINQKMNMKLCLLKCIKLLMVIDIANICLST